MARGDDSSHLSRVGLALGSWELKVALVPHTTNGFAPRLENSFLLPDSPWTRATAYTSIHYSFMRGHILTFIEPRPCTRHGAR